MSVTDLRRSEYAVPALLVLGALVLGALDHAVYTYGLPGLIAGAAAALLLFAVCGDALAQALVPADWWPVRELFALPLGAAASGMVLMACGVAHVPLHVSLWVTLALGGGASAVVRRRRAGERGAVPVLARADRLRALAPWLVALVVIFGVALIPAGRFGVDTTFGENPDAMQVVGIAVLFQHVPPTATDVRLPIDSVPPEWRFRYPIFYPLAAASSLSHRDPIRVFPAMVALLVVACAFGFAMLAVECLGAPAAAGPLIAGAVAVGWVLDVLAWHPYWNQLWGLTLFPYALLFGWKLLRGGGARIAVLTAITLLMLWLAYPLALPYPLVILAALAVAHPPHLRLRRPGTPRAWAGGAITLLLLAPAVVGAVIKLSQAISQLVTPGSTLWSGDVTSFLPVGDFVGTGGGIIPALLVAAVAALGVRALPRREALAVGAALVGLCLLDLRFRLVSSGSYMDFKHLSFVGTLILVFAASAVARLIVSRRGRTAAAGAVIAVAWTGVAFAHDSAYGLKVPQQVLPAMFDLHRWAAELPPGASIRIDIPSQKIGGYQLWASYMLASHPVDSPTPLLHTTYAYAPYGLRADYSLSLSHDPLRAGAPDPPPAFTVGPPVHENSLFVLRRIRWPRRYDYIRDTSSLRLVSS